MIYIILLISSILFAEHINENQGVGERFSAGPSSILNREIGQWGYPDDPMIDRAQGFLLRGSAKTKTSNYGNYMDWDDPDWILLFNSNTSSSNADFDLGEDGDEMQRVDVEPLMPGQTLMVIRQGEDEDFEFSGRNYVVWDRLSKLGGDEPIALINSSGTRIDQVGSAEKVTYYEVAGISGATRNHTLIRKSNIISGNTNWEESAGTNAQDSEWEVYDEDTFEDIFQHSCFPE